MPKIKETLEREVDRKIEEVIKVDQTDEQVIAGEMSEYVITNNILDHYLRILEAYNDMPQKPNDGVGIWVSGFFGSGKSSFAKMLGLALSGRDIENTSAADRLAARRSDNDKFGLLLKQITERIPSDAVIFDVSTDRGVKSGNQTLTEITNRLFLKSLGYAQDFDVAQLEIELEEDGKLKEFEQKYQEVHKHEWNKRKSRTATALSTASQVMHELEPATYPSADSWVQAARNRTDITPGDLAKRCIMLMGRRAEGRNLVVVVDEVGQFVARDVQKMLDLQAIVQNFGVHGKGKLWLVVTSQEKLTELVGGIDDKRVELARLMDRFPQELQVHLEPSDISEVTSRRVLSKNANGQQMLRTIFEQHEGKLSQNIHLTSDQKLPALEVEPFIELYPLLPYQIDLIISIVSGLRTQSGASKHVGGANRTIIKLAQQLMIHQNTNLAEAEVGQLTTIDMIYDLVSGNIPSEKRGKIDEIARKVEHPLAPQVGKAICLLEFVKTIHRTEENIAATLHQAVDSDSRLPEVKEALQELERAIFVRQGDGGYRIPSPAEDDWERQRSALAPRPTEENRLRRETVKQLWTPQPSHKLLDTKLFKAGLFFHDRQVVPGDVDFYLTLAQSGTELDAAIKAGRKRSQNETKSIFWIANLDPKIAEETDEYFRSKEILAKKQRSAQTADEVNLVGDEKRRMKRHESNLRTMLKTAMLSGTIFFRGNDRSPDPGASDVAGETARVLEEALPEVFSRYGEAAAKIKKQDLDALFTEDNLRGLPPVFTTLKLISEEKGQTVFDTNSGVLDEVFQKIKNRTDYGETATGNYLATEFEKDPFGWEFDVVRLLITSLLRAGKIEATAKGAIIDSALSLEAKNTLSRNNSFNATSFRPKVGIEFTHLIDANAAYQTTFGKDLQELEQGAVARELREAVAGPEENIQAMNTLMVRYQLPAAEVLTGALDQIRAIRTGNEEQTILTFNSSFQKLKQAIDRANNLEASLSKPQLQDLSRARSVMSNQWPFLDKELDLDPDIRAQAEALEDYLKQELFFQRLPEIEQCATAIEKEFTSRHEVASQKRVEVYTEALGKLSKMESWAALTEDQQEAIAKPLNSCSQQASTETAIPLLRSDTDACNGRFQKAIEDMLQLIDGNRLFKMSASTFFGDGIETEEQLEEAISRLREECAKKIAEGKKILIS